MMLNFLVLLLLLTPTVSPQMFPEASKGLTLAFSNIELRKNQIKDLEQTLPVLKNRADETQKIIASTLRQIGTDITEVQKKLPSASEPEADYLNKKIALLNDRKQNLFDFQELWKSRIEICDQRIKLVNDFIDFLQSSRSELKPAYSWKEYRDAQIRISENTIKVEVSKNKRDSVKKQKTAAQERLTSWEKQREAKHKEREKISWSVDGDKRAGLDSVQIKQQTDILYQEICALNEKIDRSKVQIEKLESEGKYWEDHIEFEQSKLNEQKSNILNIESRLILDYNDIELAKNEWKSEIQKALIIKEEINQLRGPKKQRKEKSTQELEVLEQRLSDLKQQGPKEQASYTLIKTQLRKLTAYIQSLNKELLLLDAKKELADILTNEKELQFNMVELRYKLRIETDDLDIQISTFRNKKDLALSIARTLKDKRTEAITSLIETNRAIEHLKNVQEKLKSNKNQLQENQIQTIYNLLEETKNIQTQQLEYTQSFLAVNADLITHQEKIINQYDLILNELEMRQKSYNIWKRSPKAISLDALYRAWLEAEAFFTQLYWETPTYLKPSTTVNFIKHLSSYEFVMLLACIMLYLFLFFICRFLLLLAQHKNTNILDQYQGQAPPLYLHLIQTVLTFILEHFVLLFTWTFIFLHIFTDFKYIFTTLSPFLNSYFISLFYLLSIPIFVYLSGRFINQLNDLNRQLSYLFFTETLQDKFILLITVLCYATATLLPLRLAILSYVDTLHSDLVTVIIAAYSLICVVVFLLFFGKENILKFIPANTTFLIWLKRKIDKHYYPVFLFCMGLFILANPYIGYSNMSWFLAFAVPATTLLLYILFTVHFYIRKYAVFMFMKEEDDEMIDKFEHAKAYYGFFVIFLFVSLSFLTFVAVLRIWGIDYTPTDLWKALSEQWVIRFGVDSKIGFIEFITLAIFVTTGFLVSSLIHKFILNRFFDILRAEPGTQNTFSRIAHYTIIFIALILGLNAIHLEQFIFWFGASFGIVLGLSLKDIISDFVAGFFVLIERPIEIGNYIQIDEIRGTVHKISARSTTIITGQNHSVIIPNKDLILKWIINWGHGRFAVGFEMNIRVNQNSDPDLVKKVLQQVIQSNPFVLKVPGIVVRLEDIEEYALYFLTRAFISARRVKEQWEIAATIRSEIIKAFKEQGIVLAKPARVFEFSKNAEGCCPKAIDIKFDK